MGKSVISRPPVKGALFRMAEQAIVDEYRFQYNPTVFKQNRKAVYYKSKTPGQFLPGAQFVRFDSASWQIDLLLYGKFGEINVEREVSRLELFVAPGPAFNLNAPQFVSPGRSKLVWGKWVFDVVFDDFDVEHFMFDKQLRPVASRVSMKFTPVSAGLRTDIAQLDRLRALSGIGG
jgi:hypothetical protein